MAVDPAHYLLGHVEDGLAVMVALAQRRFSLLALVFVRCWVQVLYDHLRIGFHAAESATVVDSVQVVLDQARCVLRIRLQQRDHRVTALLLLGLPKDDNALADLIALKFIFDELRVVGRC